MIIKFENFNLNESPDTVWWNNNRYHVEDSEAMPFICEVDEKFTKIKDVFIRPVGGNYHGSLGEKETDYNSDSLAFKGRLWTETKLISFWVYPSPRLFKQIIKKLEEITGFRIFKNGWTVEVLKNKEGELKVDDTGNDKLYSSDLENYDKKDFISVDKYIGSGNVSDEEMATHLLNWKEKEKLKKERGVKGFGSAKTAWDKPNNIKWRQTLRQEGFTTKFSNYEIITESPDSIPNYEEDVTLRWTDEDALPFFVDVNSNHTIVENVYIGSYSVMHKDILDFYENRAYAGRLWDDSKVISFWIYPNKDLFKQIINLLEEELDIKMFNNGWKIEVVTNENTGDIKIDEYDPHIEDDDDDAFFQGLDQADGINKIIPIEEYIGSEDQSKELMAQHLLNWKEKEKLKKERGIKGFGSAKTAWDKPKNIKWRQAIYQENKKNNDN